MPASQVQLNPIATALLVSAALLVAGCRTTRVDWQARVGTYTYDQAVIELGPPDKQATLTDGTRVADWLTRRGGASRVAVGGFYGYGPYCYGPPYPAYVYYYKPDYYLRLIFDPKGKLKDWKRFAR